MAKKQVYDGNALRFISVRVGADVLPDTPVRIGNINGYTMTDSLGGAAANGLHSSQIAGFATIATKGSFHVQVDTTGAGATSGGHGTPVYIDGSGDLTLDSAATDAEVWGYVIEDVIPAGANTELHVAIASSI